MIEKITDKYNEKVQSKEKAQDILNAEKLNFLSDTDGKNHYVELKDKPLICTGIEDLNTSKFLDLQYSIRRQRIKYVLLLYPIR